MRRRRRLGRVGSVNVVSNYFSTAILGREFKMSRFPDREGARAKLTEVRTSPHKPGLSFVEFLAEILSPKNAATSSIARNTGIPHVWIIIWCHQFDRSSAFVFSEWSSNIRAHLFKLYFASICIATGPCLYYTNSSGLRRVKSEDSVSVWRLH